MSVSVFIIIMSTIKSVSRASRDSIPVFLVRTPIQFGCVQVNVFHFCSKNLSSVISTVRFNSSSPGSSKRQS